MKPCCVAVRNTCNSFFVYSSCIVYTVTVTRIVQQQAASLVNISFYKKCYSTGYYCNVDLIKNTPGVKKGGQELNRPC